ncbi:hypothetical protein KFE25_007390 [Diacronema lutheri]|uniref:Ubiquitin-like protease family profile domain-containing protein n=1 Tax=Diacronema lutheri TaxID=2081491 RepID=A0A8J5XUZ1_DIALT|nr:hypothetical protein KFE25_007390 [Diacronema lutheri]
MGAERNVQIGDVSLCREDIAFLVPPRWINDQLIAAAFELLRARHAPPDERVLCVGPSEAYMIAQLADPTQLPSLFAPLKLETRQLVLMPVSDHDEPDDAGGTHWSLLAFYRQPPDAFFAFDSLSHLNLRAAEHLARRVAPLLGASHSRVVAVPTPQQQNGYDCGMYTIAIADVCAAHVGKDVDEVADAVRSAVTAEAVQRRRKEFIRTLQAMLQDGGGSTPPTALATSTCAPDRSAVLDVALCAAAPATTEPNTPPR